MFWIRYIVLAGVLAVILSLITYICNKLNVSKFIWYSISVFIGFSVTITSLKWVVVGSPVRTEENCYNVTITKIEPVDHDSIMIAVDGDIKTVFSTSDVSYFGEYEVGDEVILNILETEYSDGFITQEHTLSNYQTDEDSTTNSFKIKIG